MITSDKKLFRLSAVAILLLLIMVRLLIYAGTRLVVATNNRVENSGEILTVIGTLEASLDEGQNAIADYLASGDEKTLEPFQQALANAPKFLDQIQTLSLKDTTQSAQLRVLEPCVSALLRSDQRLIEQRRQGSSGAKSAVIASQEDGELRGVRRTISAAVQDENQRLTTRSKQVSVLVSRAIVVELVLGAGAAGLLLFAYLFIQLDLNEKAKVLSAQQESEEKIRLLLNSTAEAMYGIDLNGLCTFCNPACLEILGYRSAEDLIGKNMHELTHHTRSDGSPYPVLECKGYQAMRHGLGTHVDDEVLWRPDGTSFPVEYWSYPIRHADKIIGTVITFLDISKRRRSESYLQQVHGELNDALRASEMRAFENAQLSNLGDLFQSCQTVDEACKISTNILRSIFGASSGALFIAGDSPNSIEMAATWHGIPNSSQRFTVEDCWALRRGKLHSVAASDSAVRCGHVNGLGGYVCVPLAAQGETLGVLYVEDASLSSDTEPLGQELERRAEAVAERISLSLANLKLREMLRNQSIRDSLTGLFNRRYLEESLTRELHRAARKQRSVALVMIDLDHFKQFNDAFGHPAGDALLREFAAVLKRRVRAGDVACRFGGEEFCIIITETDARGASVCADQVRQDIKQVNIHYMGQGLGSVTLSAGVAVFPSDGQSAEDLVHAGDVALYRAKSEGRDRVVIYEQIPEAPTEGVPGTKVSAVL